MIEIERRYQITKEDSNRLLSSQDLTWGPSERVTDVTFGPSGAESMQIDGWVVRLREKGTSVSLEHKSPANADWTRWNEIAIQIDSKQRGVAFLKAIGLRTGLLLDRSRRIAKWQHLEVSLDSFALLGEFIELELLPGYEDETQISKFRERFSLESAPEVPAYGQLMLARLKSDPSLVSLVEMYISSW